jgi:hypothetical protein
MFMKIPWMETEGNAGRDGERVIWFVVFGLHWQRKQNLVRGDIGKGVIMGLGGMGTGTRSCVPEVLGLHVADGMFKGIDHSVLRIDSCRSDLWSYLSSSRLL